MKKYITACMLSLPVLCVFYFLMLPKAMINMTNYFSFGVIATGFLVWLCHRNALENIRAVDRKYHICALCCTLIFLVMLPLEDLLKSPLLQFEEFLNGTNILMGYLYHGFTLDAGVVKIIYSISMAGYLAGLVGSVFLLLIYYFMRRTDTRIVDEENIKYLGKTKIYIYTVPVILFTAIYMISALPVMALPDYTAVKNTVGVWDFWKPLAWQYFIAFCSEFGCEFLIVFVHALFWLWVNNYALGVIWHYASEKGCRLYIVWSIISTYPYMQLMSSYDNSIFSTAFLGLIVAALEIIQKGTRGKKENLKWIIFCAVVLVFRSEGFYIAIAVMIVQLIYEYRKKILDKKLWLINIVVLLCVHMCVEYMVPLVSGMDISENEEYWRYGLPLNNMAGIVSYGLQIDEEDAAVLEQIMPIEEWKDNYMPENSDNVSKPWGAVGERINKFNELHLGPQILSMNLKYFMKYPLHYLKIHGDIINIVWKISPEVYNEWSTVYVRDPVMPDNYAFLETGATLLTKNISDFAYTMPVIHSFTNRGGIYLFLMFILIVKLWLDNHKALLLPCIEALFIPGILFFSCVVPDTRYVLPLIEAGIFLFSLTFFQKCSQTKERLEGMNDEYSSCFNSSL